MRRVIWSGEWRRELRRRCDQDWVALDGRQLPRVSTLPRWPVATGCYGTVFWPFAIIAH